MAGLKRFMRPSVLISVIGHVGVLAMGLFLVSANSLNTPVTPDAMMVEVVPPSEAPRLSGTPSELRSSGSEASAPSNRVDPVGESPPKPPSPAVKPPQQKRADAKSSAPKAKTQPAQPDTAEAKTAQQGVAMPDAARADVAHPEMTRNKAPEPQPDESRPHPEETPDRQETAEQFAELALVGGQLGGGFEAPPVDTKRRGVDFTIAFRERVSSCSSLPPGIGPADKVTIVMRVFFNRDGTLAALPQPLEPITTAKQQALMESSISALEKCQPYTMLPQDKYAIWKTLDLTFYPLNSFSN